MTWFAQSILSLIGRCMFCAIFVLSAAGNKIPNFSTVAETMGTKGIPEPRTMLFGAIAFLLVGSALVALGYRARLGAGLLLVFLVAATYFFHDFWNLAVDSDAYREQQIQFLKNLGLAGMAVFILANGPGLGAIGPRARDDQEFV
ncbi:MAG TPA: DoxX family protein [Pirellulaceae bacterium]